MAKRKTKAAKAKTKAKKPAAKPAKAASKPSPSSRPRTKSEIMAVLAEQTGLTKRDVSGMFASLAEVVTADLGKKGCGVFTVPGLMKIRRIHKPAKKARKGINPFTGEETMFKAKPAHNVIRIRPLKALKDMV